MSQPGDSPSADAPSAGAQAGPVVRSNSIEPGDIVRFRFVNDAGAEVASVVAPAVVDADDSDLSEMSDDLGDLGDLGDSDDLGVLDDSDGLVGTSLSSGADNLPHSATRFLQKTGGGMKELAGLNNMLGSVFRLRSMFISALGDGRGRREKDMYALVSSMLCLYTGVFNTVGVLNVIYKYMPAMKKAYIQRRRCLWRMRDQRNRGIVKARRTLVTPLEARLCAKWPWYAEDQSKYGGCVDACPVCMDRPALLQLGHGCRCKPRRALCAVCIIHISETHGSNGVCPCCQEAFYVVHRRTDLEVVTKVHREEMRKRKRDDVDVSRARVQE